MKMGQPTRQTSPEMLLEEDIAEVRSGSPEAASEAVLDTALERTPSCAFEDRDEEALEEQEDEQQAEDEDKDLVYLPDIIIPPPC